MGKDRYIILMGNEWETGLIQGFTIIHKTGSKIWEWERTTRWDGNTLMETRNTITEKQNTIRGHIYQSTENT